MTKELVTEELCTEKFVEELGDRDGREQQKEEDIYEEKYLEDLEKKGEITPNNNKRDAKNKNPQQRNKKVDAKNKEADDFFADNFGRFFFQIAGKDELIDAFELQRVMEMIFRRKLNGFAFSLECCRSILATSDTDRDGRLCYDQFKRTWYRIMQWKACFEDCDVNKDTFIDRHEMERAFGKLQLDCLSEEARELIFVRFSDRRQLIHLDSFIQILCKVETATKWSQEMDKKKVSLDEFLIKQLYS